MIQHIADGMMVYKWSFLRNGQEVVVSTGTVHGLQGIYLSLYNALTGTLLKTWDGDETGKPPSRLQAGEFLRPRFWSFHVLPRQER